MTPLPVALVINSPPHPLKGFTVYLLDKTPVKLTKTLLFLVQIAQEFQSTLPTDPTKIMCPKSSFCQHCSESCDSSVPLYFHAALSDPTFGYIHSTKKEYSLCARPCLGSGVQQ